MSQEELEGPRSSHLKLLLAFSAFVFQQSVVGSRVPSQDYSLTVWSLPIFSLTWFIHSYIKENWEANSALMRYALNWSWKEHWGKIFASLLSDWCCITVFWSSCSPWLNFHPLSSVCLHDWKAKSTQLPFVSLPSQISVEKVQVDSSTSATWPVAGQSRKSDKDYLPCLDSVIPEEDSEGES